MLIRSPGILCRQWRCNLYQLSTCKECNVYLLCKLVDNTDNVNNNCIVKSIRSINQKSKFYMRAVPRFLYTKCNQCGVFSSLYWDYELKILHFRVKLAYLGVYFTEKHGRQRLTQLTVLLKLQYINCFSNFRAERCQNYWLYQKMLQTKVVQN